MTESKAFYGLRKLFWVLPHPDRPGSAVLSSLSLESPTVLVGSNGVGKTSLLRLVAFLFGHPDPDRLVGGGGSFRELYLAPPSGDGAHRRLSGYLGGHFLGREGPTTVIAYAHGNQYRYLVLPGHVEPDILREGRRFLTPNELHERLAAMGLVGESVVEVRSPEAYARLFAERSRSPLRGHAFPSGGKVSLGWFLGLSLGEALKEEWVRQFLVDLALPPSEGEAYPTANFQERLREIREELEELGEMAKTMPEVEEYRRARGDLVAKFKLYGATRLLAEEALPRLEEEVRGLEAEAKECEDRLQELLERREKDLEALQGELEELSMRKGELSGQIRALQEALRRAQAAMAPWSHLDGAHLPLRLEEVRRELRLLEGEIAQKGAAWEAERQRRRAERERERAERLQEVGRRKEALREEMERAVEEARTRLETAWKEEEARLEAERKELEEERLKLRESLARLEAQNEPQDDEWRRAKEEIARLKEALGSFREALLKKRNELEGAKRELERERRGLEEKREEVLKLREALGRLRQEGSLLGFLDKNVPSWRQGVGRVLSPSLLERNDLEPVLFSPPSLPPDRVGVGEVALRVSHLPVPPDPLADLEVKLHQAEEALKGKEEEVRRSEDWVRALEEDVRARERREEELRESLLRLEGWLKERRERFLAERKEALARLRKGLAQVEEGLASLASRRKAMEREWKGRLEKAQEEARKPFAEALKVLAEEERKLRLPVEDEPPPTELLPLEERRRALEREAQTLGKALEAWQALRRAEEEARRLPALEAELAQVEGEIHTLKEREKALKAAYEREEKALREERDRVRQEASAKRARWEALKRALNDTPAVDDLRKRLSDQFPSSAPEWEAPFPELPPDPPEPERLRRLSDEVEKLEERVIRMRQHLGVPFRRLDRGKDLLPEDFETHYEHRGLALSRSLSAQVHALEAKLTQARSARLRLAQLVRMVEDRLKTFAFPTVRWAEVRLEGNVEREERELEEALGRLREDVIAVVEHFQRPNLQPLFPAGDLEASLHSLERVGRRYAEIPLEKLLADSFRLRFVLERGGRRVALSTLGELRGKVSTGQGAAMAHALAASLVSLLDGGSGVRLPLLVDELGRLDGENAAALFQGVEALGLVLLGATPSKETLVEVARRAVFKVVEVRGMAVKPQGDGPMEGVVGRREG
ncbi:ATP-binding protein [Thermus hydrothermalis]|uniref:ATP-binding protein n=1 Tax=Thermus hydrothermalis TaxID=2908148 RepID=UPI001FAB1855|nr:ATP-binding protein [Thermus hydrothermalis]